VNKKKNVNLSHGVPAFSNSGLILFHPIFIRAGTQKGSKISIFVVLIFLLIVLKQHISEYLNTVYAPGKIGRKM